MSLPKTLLLAAFLLAGVFYIYKVELPKEQEVRNAGLFLGGRQADEIQQMHIKNAKGDFVLARVKESERKTEDHDLDPALWEVQGIKGAALDEATLRTAVKEVVDLQLGKAITPEDLDPDLKVYGLGGGETAVAVTSGGQSNVILLGKKNEYVGARYAKLPGKEEVYLIADSLFAAVDKGRDEFRDRTPVDFVDTDVKSFVVENEKGKLVLEKNEQGEWAIKEPVSLDASNERVLNILREVTTLRAAEFIDFSEAALPRQQYGLEKPLVKLRIGFADSAKPPLEVLLSKAPATKAEKGAAKNIFFKEGTPSVYTLIEDVIPRFAKAVVDVRERNLTRFRLDELVSAEFIVDGMPAVKIIRNADGYTVNGKKGDEVFVREVLNNVAQLEALDFPENKKGDPLAAPKLKLILTSKPAGDKAVEKKLILKVGAESPVPAGKAFWAGVTDDDTKTPEFMFTIGEESFKKILAREETLIEIVPTPEPSPAMH